MDPKYKEKRAQKEANRKAGRAKAVATIAVKKAALL